MLTLRPGGTEGGAAAGGSDPAALPCWGLERPSACLALALELTVTVASTALGCGVDMLNNKRLIVWFSPALAIADQSRDETLQATTTGSDIKLKLQNSTLLLGADGGAISPQPFPEGAI